MCDSQTAIELFSNDDNVNIDSIIKKYRKPALDIHAALIRARKPLEKYCLHHGEVKSIRQEDTGIIIGLIAYFIANEPKINRTKLEAYILWLNAICFRVYNKNFFDCDLTSSGRISDFKTFINVMKEKELIRSGEGNTYRIYDTIASLIKELKDIFAGIDNLLLAILQEWGRKNGRQALSAVQNFMGYSSYNPKIKKTAQTLINYTKHKTQENEDIIDAEIEDDLNNKDNDTTCLIPKK